MQAIRHAPPNPRGQGPLPHLSAGRIAGIRYGCRKPATGVGACLQAIRHAPPKSREQGSLLRKPTPPP